MKYFKCIVLLMALSAVLFACPGEQVGRDPNELRMVAGASELTARAEEKQRIGAFAEAIDELRVALKIDAKFIPAHYRMGVIFEEWGRKREAVKAYKAALKLAPDHIESRLGLGSVYSKMVKNSLAIKEFKKVAKLKPKDKEIYFKIALEFWYMQKLPEAVQYYLKVIELEPNHLQAHLNLASVYEKMKDWPKTLGEIETAVILARKNKDEHSISVAKEKLKFIEGRMNMTDNDLARKTQPPFD